MAAFPDWASFAVHQRRIATGCIAACFEMILRAKKAKGIDFNAFQDDFDFDRFNLYAGPRMNTFANIATAVKERYPWVSFERRSFVFGDTKVAFIDELVAREEPVLLIGFMGAVAWCR